MSVHNFPNAKNDNRELTTGDKVIGWAALLIVALVAVAYALRWPLIALVAIFAAVMIFA